MKMKTLGSLDISNLCLGGNVFGWTVDEASSFPLLDAFQAGGGNFIDTANVYSRWVDGHQGGESEAILGRWMKARGNRDKIVIATKVGMDMGPGQSGLAKAYILKAVEDSLTRLQTDYIDLYISHKEDETTPIAETLEAYGQLIAQGKVRTIGASNYSSKGLRQALEVSRKASIAPYRSLQPHYNLYDREQFERELLPVCEEFSLSITPYFALASGFLTGKYRKDSDLKQSVRGGGMNKYFTDRGWRLLDALDKVSKSENATNAEVALAWLMSRPFITAPIASATTLDQMKSLLTACRLELSADSLECLDQASS